MNCQAYFKLEFKFKLKMLQIAPLVSLQITRSSKFLTPLNILWFKFGLFLGKIVSPIVMGIIFFIVVTPIGFLMRILKKDLLNLKFNNKDTYWIKKDEHKSKMKNQF